MVRKVFKTGNSFVISLPKNSMEQLGLQEGSEVSLTVEPEEGRLIIEPAKKQIVEIDPAFARQVEEFIEQYRPALEALAK